MPPKPVKRSPNYYSRYLELFYDPRDGKPLTKKQFNYQSPHTRAILSYTPPAEVGPICTGFSHTPTRHSHSNLKIAEDLRRSGGRTTVSIKPSLSKDRRARVIAAFLTPTPDPLHSGFARLSFWQRVKFMLSNIFRKRSK